jgi:hypothetical protein
VVRDGGETLGYLLAQIERFCDSATSHDQPTEVHRVGLRSVPFLLSFADVHIGWLLLWHAEVALDAIDTGTVTQRGGAFYHGNVAAAVFFAETVLPRLAADRVVIESQGLADGIRGRGVLRAATASLVASPVGAAR